MLDTVFTGIKALIIAIASDIYPDPNKILRGLTNNWVGDPLTQYVTMTELPLTKSMSCLPIYRYDITNGNSIFLNPESTPFQVDFYGNECRIAAERFRLALQYFYGDEFLTDYGASVHRVWDLINLTNAQAGKEELGPFERGNYLPRYAARFTLFVNNELVISEPSFDATVDNLYFVP